MTDHAKQPEDVSCAGPALLAALEQATSSLAQRVDEVNALNVFPVPDGDTGSNMLATLQAALEAGATSARRDGSLGSVAAALSMGALMGARGNSGVILSQLFRGMAEEMQESEAIDGEALARALQRGCEAAYAAVARPVEGTILSVTRDVAAAARHAAAESSDLESVLSASVAEAQVAVERTPSQLAVLQQAGVVDAGARGFELILAGVLAHLRGEAPAAIPRRLDEPVLPIVEGPEEEGFGYETVFVISPRAGRPLDVAAIRDELERMGESVLVAGDERTVKIHIHNDRPDQVIAYGLSLGSLNRIAVENLDRQARDRRTEAEPRTADDEAGDVRERHALPATARPPAAAATAGAAIAGAATAGAPAADGAEREARAAVGPAAAGPAVVAVASGEGLERLFRALGATAVVHGRDGANASAGELAEAIRATGCGDVLVLPNNPNVRLAARQGGALCADQRVVVLPTRNQAEGVAALLAFDAAQGIDGNVARMTTAAQSTPTVQVAAAVRDARIDGRSVRRGQHIVLGADQQLLAVDEDRNRAIVTALRGRLEDPELITIYHGEGTDAAQAAELGDVLRREHESAEVEIVDGGQRHYSYLITAE